MAEPEADRRDVDETQEAFCSLVVARCDTPSIFELIEASFDQIAETIQRAVHADAHFPGFPHGYLSQNITGIHRFAYSISIIATIRQQHSGARQIVRHDQIKTKIVGCLARRDLGSHG